MQSCITCSMPFEESHVNDIALETEWGPVCKFDSEMKEGKMVMKSPEAIFDGGIEFYAMTCTDGDKALAEKLTRRNMRTLPYWQSHHFALLDGVEATDAEHDAAMAKLQNMSIH